MSASGRISIPIIIWGSKLVLHFMDRFPLVITLGAALLGWIAGSMAVGDISLPSLPSWSHYAAGLIGAKLVLIVGTLVKNRQQTDCELSPESERGEQL